MPGSSIPPGTSRHTADLPTDVLNEARAYAAEVDAKVIDVTRALYDEFLANKSLRQRVLAAASAHRAEVKAETAARLAAQRKAAASQKS